MKQCHIFHLSFSFAQAIYLFTAAQIDQVAKVNALQMGQTTQTIWAVILKYNLKQ